MGRGTASSDWPAQIESAAALAAAGAEVQRGTIDDLDVLAATAAASDGVIHLAFKHDLAFSGDFQGAATADRRAVEIFGEALAGSDRPLVIASGILGLITGRVATERDGHDGAGVTRSWPGSERTGSDGRVRALVGLARRPVVDRAAFSDQPR